MTAKRRITFVLPTLDLSGGVRVIATLARELHARGHDILVVAGPPLRPPVKDRLRALVKGPSHKWWPDPHKHHFVGLDVPIRRIEGPVTDADVPDADAVVATWWETADPVSRLSPSRGAKCYYVQHHEVHMAGQPADLVNATFRLPLHAFVCSRWVQQQVAPHAGRDLPVVPYGVDRAVFTAPPRDKRPAPTVGFMYSDVPFKGVDTTLAAIGHARARVPDLRIVTFGSRPPTDSLPLPPGATFEQAPAQARIAELYAMCDAWLVGSRAEGFGLPMLEAMACRTPLITTRTGGALDLVDEAINGHVVDVEDAHAMGDRIADVAALSPDAWRAMSDAAHATAARHTWSAAADTFLREIDHAAATTRVNAHEGARA